VVYGGGFAALQAARLALRLGAEEVKAVHPAPLEQWPAGPDAVRAARQEGVEMLDLHRVTGLEGSDGRLIGVVLKRTKATNPDAVDRHTLVGYGEAIPVRAAVFVAAVDRRGAVGDAPDLAGLARGVLGNLIVDGEYRLGRPGWYAAGEAATGAATIVDSMGTGRRAAEAIHRAMAPGGGV
jgi:glutamate synthase (NADPH/NADH) small chain